MVGATPAAAAAIVNGCCTLMATNPTKYRSLESNQFSGVVPPELGELVSLETL
jgi:hypothetical protein